jgi:3-hydroxyacyl-CoA dehydrogenase
MVGQHLVAQATNGAHGSGSTWPVAVIGACWVAMGIALLVAPRQMFRITMWTQSWQFAQRPQPSRRWFQVQRAVALLAIPAGLAMVVVGLVHH